MQTVFRLSKQNTITSYIGVRIRNIVCSFAAFARIGAEAIPQSEKSARAAVNDRAEQLLDLYGNAILRMAYSYLHNMSDAEEILQETLIRYLQKAPAFRDPAHEKAWLLRVAANLSKNRIQYNSYRRADELSEELAAEGREDLSFVWEAVKELPDRFREVIHLFYYEGLSTKEIAEVLHRNESTVRWIFLKMWRTYGSIAAAVAVILVGALAYQNVSREPEAPVTEMNVFGPAEAASLSELEAAVGYEVGEIENLPFTAEETVYLSYSGESAEIQYRTGEQQIIYTKSKTIGGENGHFETYETEQKIEVSGKTVLLKGNGDGFQIASWDDGTYGYMIYSDVPIEEQDLIKMVPQ